MDGIRKGNKKSFGPICRATGGRVPEDISDASALPTMADGMDDGMDELGGAPAPARLDRGARKSSAPVNVNVTVVSSKPTSPGPSALPPMPAPGGPPPPPMGGPGPMPPPPGMPMRKDGGRVNGTDPGGVGAKVRGVASEAKRVMNQSVGDLDEGEKKGSWKNFGKDILRLAPNDKKPERASGGRVSMPGGAGGGLGRLKEAADAAKTKK